MFEGFTDRTFEFFMAIRFNNNREFFQENKGWYAEAVRERMLSLAEALAPCMEAIDPDFELRPGACVCRVNRDIRFSHDRSPYKDYTFMKFRYPGEAGQGAPGFYFDMSDNGASCGMGLYGRNIPMMNALRKDLSTAPDEFLTIARGVLPDFTLMGDVVKRMKLPDALPDAAKPWYPLRGFYMEHDLHDFSLLKSPALVDELAARYRQLAPMYRYLTRLTPIESM